MWSLVAAHVPPGEARADLIQTMLKHKIPFNIATDPEDLLPFLRESSADKEGSHSLRTNSIERDTVIQNPPTSSSDSKVFNLDQHHNSASTMRKKSKKTRRSRKIGLKPIPQQKKVPIGTEFSSPQPEVKEEFEPSASGKQVDPESSEAFQPTDGSDKSLGEAQSTHDFSRRLQERDTVTESPFTSSTELDISVGLQQAAIFASTNDLFGCCDDIPEIDSLLIDFDLRHLDLKNLISVDEAKMELDQYEATVEQVPSPSSLPPTPASPQQAPIDLDNQSHLASETDLTKESEEVERVNSDEKREELGEEEQEEMEEDEEDFSDSGALPDPMEMDNKLEGSTKKHGPFRCDVCQKVLADARNLRNHLLIHKGVMPFECDVCQKRFRIKTQLTHHSRVHTGERPYHCEVCQKGFSKANGLTRHMRIHTGEYECDVCKKCFTAKSSLNSHKHMHTGEKPFECEDCKKEFANSNYLRKHRNRCHI